MPECNHSEINHFTVTRQKFTQEYLYVKPTQGQDLLPDDQKGNGWKIDLTYQSGEYVRFIKRQKISFHSYYSTYFCKCGIQIEYNPNED